MNHIKRIFDLSCQNKYMILSKDQTLSDLQIELAEHFNKINCTSIRNLCDSITKFPLDFRSQ